MGRGVLGSMLFLKITRPISLRKLKVVTKQVFVDEDLVYFCFNWTHWASSVNFHHTVYFGNKPKACKEANCSCKKEEDQNHYHSITEVQDCACCPRDLQFGEEVVYGVYQEVNSCEAAGEEGTPLPMVILCT